MSKDEYMRTQREKAKWYARRFGISDQLTFASASGTVVNETQTKDQDELWLYRLNHVYPWIDRMGRQILSYETAFPDKRLITNQFTVTRESWTSNDLWVWSKQFMPLVIDYSERWHAKQPHHTIVSDADSFLTVGEDVLYEWKYVAATIAVLLWKSTCLNDVVDDFFTSPLIWFTLLQSDVGDRLVAIENDDTQGLEQDEHEWMKAMTQAVYQKSEWVKREFELFSFFDFCLPITLHVPTRHIQKAPFQNTAIVTLKRKRNVSSSNLSCWFVAS